VSYCVARHAAIGLVEQSFLEKGHHGLIERHMEANSIEARRILTDLPSDLRECVAARGQENKMIDAGHHTLLGSAWKLVSNDRGVPGIGSLLILFGAPQLDWHGDAPQTSSPEQKARRWRGDDGSFDSRIVHPFRVSGNRLQLITVALFNETAFRSIGPSGTELSHPPQVGRSSNLDQSRESSQGEAKDANAVAIEPIVPRPG